MTEDDTAVAISALMVVIPTLAATTSSKRVLLWMSTLALTLATAIFAVRFNSPAQTVVGTSAILGAIATPVFIVTRLRLALSRQVQHHEELSRMDPLTGLLNRRGLLENVLGLSWDLPAPTIGAMVLDIDHFKQINDRHGHAIGDAVLQSVAASIRNSTPEDSLVCRYGGEEFLVLLSSHDPNDLRSVADHTRTTIAAATTVTASVGLAIMQLPTESVDALPAHALEDLIYHADQCTYSAKAAGRNRTVACFVDPPPIINDS